MSSNTRSLSQAFISLGSNLGKPISQIEQSLKELNQLPLTNLLVSSSLYRSAPVAPAAQRDQPDYVNAVAKLTTKLSPCELLAAMLEIEQYHGRIRTVPNAPRTLDLDLLLYDDLICHQKNLTLPHPRISQRAFVLKPLMEIAPNCYIPGCGPVTVLLADCQDQRIEKITK